MSRVDQPSARCWNASACELEAVADRLVALVEEFEGSFGEGYAPPAFAQRLARIRDEAERLIGP
jgi:hypothetical protein